MKFPLVLQNSKMPTNNRLCEGFVFERCEAQIANLDRASRARDEYVVALQIAMDDRGIPRVQVVETLQDLTAPRFQNLQFKNLPFMVGFLKN